MTNKQRLKAGFRKIKQQKLLILLPFLFAVLILCITYQVNILIENYVPNLTMLYKMLFSIFMFESLVIGNLSIVVLLGLPFGRKRMEKNITKIVLSNNKNPSPILLSKTKKNGYFELEFFSDTIPLLTYQEKCPEIETALNIKIISIEQGRDKRHIIISAISGKKKKQQDIIYWKNEFLNNNDFELILGESYSGVETINLNLTPHLLIGGGTGSGKTLLLKLILLQCIKKKATVFLADFKGGVDFPEFWHKHCSFVTTPEELNKKLDEIMNLLEERRNLLINAKVPNIYDYNKTTENKLNRIIVCCDEIAEILDKTGLNKEEKTLINEIESKISTLARLGRAFGIHLILSTQRPDAEILKGQIKINIAYKICGRADKILSQIILDNSEASEKISAQDQGMFLTNTGVLFKAYFLDETQLQELK